MNLNIVPARDPIIGQPMEIDPMDSWNVVPMDVARIIFQNLKGNLDVVALVCRSWKALADDEEFRKMIRPAQAFGTQEWQKYIQVDAGVEPNLPRRAYADLEREGGLLTFIPEKVKVAKENGNVEEVLLDNVEAIANLIKKPKTDLKTGFAGNSLRKVNLKDNLKDNKKPHWVWIKKEVMGIYANYEEQQQLAREENKKACGADISGLIDTATTIFMEYVRSGQRDFFWDPPFTATHQRICIRVNERDDLFRLMLGFYPDGLGVYGFLDAFCDSWVGFVCARKFFGTSAQS